MDIKAERIGAQGLCVRRRLRDEGKIAGEALGTDQRNAEVVAATADRADRILTIDPENGGGHAAR